MQVARQWRDTLSYWAAVLVRHCPQPPSVLWTTAPHRPLTGPLPCSTSLHYGSSWWLETDGWPSQTILATNSGGWPATNEPRTGGVEVACSGQIDMAETHSNGYVYDKLLKKKKKLLINYRNTFYGTRYLSHCCALFYSRPNTFVL